MIALAIVTGLMFAGGIGWLVWDQWPLLTDRDDTISEFSDQRAALGRASTHQPN